MNLQKIADNSLDSRHNTKTPVGKSQQTILDKLDVHCGCFGQAEAFFTNIGISVVSKREGRKSVPVVYLVDTSGGGINRDGEGESWDGDEVNDYIVALLKDYMV
jgi:hypothetical protein